MRLAPGTRGSLKVDLATRVQVLRGEPGDTPGRAAGVDRLLKSGLELTDWSDT